MARQFSLGFKKPNWSSMEVGVGAPLTNARIKHYIREGKYGNLKLITNKKPSRAVSNDRAARKLLTEYGNLQCLLTRFQVHR